MDGMSVAENEELIGFLRAAWAGNMGLLLCSGSAGVPKFVNGACPSMGFVAEGFVSMEAVGEPGCVFFLGVIGTLPGRLAVDN